MATISYKEFFEMLASIAYLHWLALQLDFKIK
jgi:hypothetical protein